MKNKKIFRIILVLLLLGISLGYALLSSTLTINGSSKIQGQSWDIHWNNVQVTSGSASIGTGDKAAVITPNDNTEVTYEVTLSKPGEFYEFTVDAVNGGTIDGMIDVITSTYKIGNGAVTTITSNNLPSYLNYSVSYSDDTALVQNQELKAGESETYKVRVEFKRDIDENDLPSTAQSIVFSFAVDYVQADSNATAVNHQMVGPVAPLGNYRVSTGHIGIGNMISNDLVFRNTPALAMADWQDITGIPGDTRPYYIKVEIENDIITEGYVEFVITNELKTKLKNDNCTNDNYPDEEDKEACEVKYDALVNGTYSLRGGINEESIYEANVNTIKRAFGTLASDTNICYEYISSIPPYFFCTLPGLDAFSSPTGYVVADDGGWNCSVYADGSASCGY